MKNIWIALVDDWELRGNGLGNVVEHQYNTALGLMDVYARLGIKGTFNTEVMQQLAMEKHAAGHPEIRIQRDKWIEAVETMRKRGHDVQLHIHPQWHDASYDGKYWRLDHRWNIAGYPREEIDRFVTESLAYLRGLVGNKPFETFRGGAWGVCCPSRPLFETLEKHGIRVDVSMVQGIYYDGESIRLDYTQLESPYFPYYPDYSDVRRVSATKTAVIEIPTQSVPAFHLAGASGLKRKARLLVEGVGRRIGIGRAAGPVPRAATAPAREEIPDHIVKDPFGFQRGTARHPFIMDLSSDNTLAEFQRAVDIVMQRAQARDAEGIVPLIFENHTKGLAEPGKMRKIEELLRYTIDRYGKHVQFVTLQDIAENLDRIHPVLRG